MGYDNYAFKCKNCGALEPAEAAGEREYPGACHVCGHGVVFDSVTGTKSFEDATNWIVIADEDADKFAEEHGIYKTHIKRHTPLAASTPEHEPVDLVRTAEDTQGSEDH